MMTHSPTVAAFLPVPNDHIRIMSSIHQLAGQHFKDVSELKAIQPQPPAARLFEDTDQTMEMCENKP